MRESFGHIAQCAVQLAGIHFDERSQAQKRRPVGALFVENVDGRLRCFKLVAGCLWVLEIFIELHQIHMQLNDIQGALDRAFGQAGQGGTIFPHGIAVALLETCDLPANDV